jgi:uncharacterized membrane protein YcaP (DUF421 family)
MNEWFQIDWQELFVPQKPLFGLFIRGTLTYFALFIFLRFLRKELGAIGITDVLVIVLVADASQNAMAGDYKSITEGIFLVLTIAIWDYVLDWLGYNLKFFERILRPPAIILIKDGKINRKNMRSEMITMEELTSQLRQQGIDNVKDVKECHLEGDGNLSFVKNESTDENQSASKKGKDKVV